MSRANAATLNQPSTPSDVVPLFVIVPQPNAWQRSPSKSVTTRNQESYEVIVLTDPLLLLAGAFRACD